MEKISVAIIGGDLRFVRLCKILIENHFDVWAYGIEHPDIPEQVHQVTALESLKHCSYIVGPIPFTRDGKHLFTPLSNTHISIELFMETFRNCFLCLSVLNPALIALLTAHHMAYVDLMALDEVAILNAIPTAEGAIQYAMANSEITLNDSNCLILGFGRCGKILAHKLQGIGAHVFVEARKTKDLAYISTYDYIPIPLTELTKQLGKFDFIFNTIPVQILDQEAIDCMDKNTVYIELASSPGGIDSAYCKQSGILHVPAPSLPGKVAPTTAAQILYQGLQLIIENRGKTND